ncbi:hypothetical protein DL93DRAFT_2071120 [Clavulina sp. PMI_390]|nr:hypothetical protein DL93DRAFT_2071120 [Clavulina sp. PMI_390]
MAGPNLEVFKFGLYVFFPVAIMLHYGNPEWYDKHVVPARMKFFPPLESTNKPPTDPHDIRNEIARMKAERLAKMDSQQSTHSPSAPSSNASSRLV